MALRRAGPRSTHRSRKSANRQRTGFWRRRTGRWSRWLRTGLHDLDFPVLRLRPIWDIVVIFLLLGVTLVCITGTWMACRRVRRDYLTLRR